MTKSQFNIKISKVLLAKVKRQAMMSGKSLTEHITDLVTKSLSENNINATDIDSIDKLKNLEERLLSIESIVRNREYISEKLEPFNNLEALNCTKFMRGIFDIQVHKKDFENRSIAFDDFINHLNVFIQLNQLFTDRLKEIMLSDNPQPWSGDELNELTDKDKCNCPIRKGLITWTGNTDCPSQQEICDKGEELLSLF